MIVLVHSQAPRASYEWERERALGSRSEQLCDALQRHRAGGLWMERELAREGVRVQTWSRKRAFRSCTTRWRSSILRRVFLIAQSTRRCSCGLQGRASSCPPAVPGERRQAPRRWSSSRNTCGMSSAVSYTRGREVRLCGVSTGHSTWHVTRGLKTTKQEIHVQGWSS